MAGRSSSKKRVTTQVPPSLELAPEERLLYEEPKASISAEDRALLVECRDALQTISRHLAEIRQFHLQRRFEALWRKVRNRLQQN